jgi:hypothetical protein
MKLAPIILFTYKRIPIETIQSLLLNELSKYSDLYIYSDGYKCDAEKNEILEVRRFLRNITGFNTITIKESTKNKGLATSVIDGVTDILDKFEKVIVLEDDLIVSSDFLYFMNEALNVYKENHEIWSISGFGPHLPIDEKYKSDLYLYYRGSSWGWATWNNRWRTVDWDVKDFKELCKNKNKRREFERGGNDLFIMLKLQMLGKIDSWAIRWCFSQFVQNKYTIYPISSKVINNGLADAKAVHNNGRRFPKFHVTLSNRRLVFDEKVKFDEDILNHLKEIYNIDLYTRVGYFLRQYGLYGLVKIIMNFFIKFPI